MIEPSQGIWQCPTCYYHDFHLSCINTWITEGTHEKLLSLENFPNQKRRWRCPYCNSKYLVEERPTIYTCYCGKTENPPVDAWLEPHTCGEICGKLLSPYCGHSCTQLCHPGKCGPCPQMEESYCYCGKVYEMRLCSESEYSCKNVCKKKLSCGHYCDQICHDGDCPPCQKTSTFSCMCGKVSEVRSCSDQIFQCENICNRPHSCGHHRCTRMCHSGSCDKCPLSGYRSCYCGKEEYNVPCYEDINESCGRTCDKLLDCGIHRCPDKCHKGECSSCLRLVTKPCRCGRVKKNRTKCSEEVICKIKCRNMRDCGNHKCSKRCCDGDCQPCEKICDKLLPCKNHRCKYPCHPGPCEGCPLAMTLTCPCEKIKKVVKCQRRYMLEHNVPKECKGKHKVESVPCEIQYPPCKLKCGNLLSCGNHNCKKRCHVVSQPRELVTNENGQQMTVTESNIEKDSCFKCKEPCKKLRKCNHECPLGCHLNDCPPCEVEVTVQCHCKRNDMTIQCQQLQWDSESIEPVLSCGVICEKPLQYCGHMCKELCHSGSCPSDICEEKTNVRCKCKRRKEVWDCERARRERVVRKSFGRSNNVLLDCIETCKKRRNTQKKKPIETKQPEAVTKPSKTRKRKKKKPTKKLTVEDVKQVQQTKKKKEKLIKRKNRKQKSITDYLTPEILVLIAFLILVFAVIYLKLTE
eukprot:TRINITY_DN6810_c0_g1_i7.p1 TRINITY_DN6810_c0_g1~~TRINITY_DN6810_c0_g1_i7.p1  ORF type:complete len:690 (-),score=77.20 TRINITY_DN6810_c0_g1_i7:32-2101(-)